MGSSYRHALVVGATADTVKEAWPAVPALLATADGVVIVFWAEGLHRVRDRFVSITPAALAELSAATSTVVLAFDVHDSDLLGVMGWREGTAVFQFFVPDPGSYFGLDEDELAAISDLDIEATVRDALGGQLPGLGEAFGPEVADQLLAQITLGYQGAAPDQRNATPADAAAIVEALGFGDADAVRHSMSRDDIDAEDRQREFLTALGLPLASVGWGYDYLRRAGFGELGTPVQEIDPA